MEHKRHNLIIKMRSHFIERNFLYSFIRVFEYQSDNESLGSKHVAIIKTPVLGVSGLIYLLTFLFPCFMWRY